MNTLFSPSFKYSTWRRLWVALAKAESALGLPITKAQISALEQKVEDVDMTIAHRLEKTLRHDVMAHIHAYGEQCPEAKGIIHMGATSAYVTDNTDVIQMQKGMDLLLGKLHVAITNLANFASEHASLPTLGYTHFQPAQPTTVGKRACLWLQDLVQDFEDMVHFEGTIQFLGVKGATGTAASFLSLFEGDESKVNALEKAVAKEMGFTKLFPISGQTYPRKLDARLLSVLSGFAASCHKMATDLRLLSHLGEVDEPFEEGQIGSSAMPHKRNPIRAERVCSLSRSLIALGENPNYTHALQWFERTLDDSANRRLLLPEAFLLADSLLNLIIDLFGRLTVSPAMIAQNLEKELPYLALENILMCAVKKGKDRQKVHELLRHESVKASTLRKEGKEDNLIETLKSHPDLGLTGEEMAACMRPETLTGCATSQTLHYIKEEVEPLLKKESGRSAPLSSIER